MAITYMGQQAYIRTIWSTHKHYKAYLGVPQQLYSY